MTTTTAFQATATIAEERTFDFLRTNPRGPKPRRVGLTEIRGPYYSVMGARYLADVLETMGPYVDSLKFAGGSFTLMPARQLTELIELCHRHEVTVSTGGFIERVLTQGSDAVDRYILTCRDLGFDTIEISSGFITLPADDWLRLVERVRQAGLKAKPEVGIQFGAGGATRAELIMIESEGITENVKQWRTDVAARIVDALGLEHVMFEAADPDVFAWYVKNYGPEVNLFVDHSQIVQLECLREGIWGTADLWGKVVTYKG